MSHVQRFLDGARRVLDALDAASLEQLTLELMEVREREGRVFVLGVGGSAANASHAVNDLRKLCGLEAYAPTDNVAELTARTNDEGWPATFATWLETSRLSARDLVFVLSVGGGSAERGVSMNLVAALELARKRDARIIGIVGRDGGATAQFSSACVIIPTVDAELVTPYTEAFHSVVCHLLVSDPRLQRRPTTW